jgi:hypothetical protein
MMVRKGTSEWRDEVKVADRYQDRCCRLIRVRRRWEEMRERLVLDAQGQSRVEELRCVGVVNGREHAEEEESYGCLDVCLLAWPS